MMKFVVLFALVAVAAAEIRTLAVSPVGRIVGGVETTIEDVPYQVALRVFSSHICGASIISENWIISAAHCMIYPTNWYVARIGSTTTNSGGWTHTLIRIINHAGYATNQWGIPSSDIALLEAGPMEFGVSRQPIPLYDAGEESAVGAYGVINGWGATTQGGSGSNVLRTVSVPVVSKESCDTAYSMWDGLPAGQICAAYPEGGKDSCQGDSGGPFAIDGRLAGIVSWGNGCARPGFPGVYTEIAAYRDWIQQHSGL